MFHKNVTPGTLQRSIVFLFPSLFSLPSPRLNVPRATEQHTVPLETQSPDVPRLSQSLSLFLSSFPLLSFASSQPSLAFSTLLCCVCVRSTAGGRLWSGWLQGEVALLSTVVLTSTETCQARSLVLGQGQTLQERWVLQRQKEKDVSKKQKKK